MFNEASIYEKVHFSFPTRKCTVEMFVEKIIPFMHQSFVASFRKKDCRHMSRVVRKPAFCICENKNADQLPGNREADQRLCFRYTDGTIPLLPKYKITSL